MTYYAGARYDLPWAEPKPYDILFRDTRYRNYFIQKLSFQIDISYLENDIERSLYEENILSHCIECRRCDDSIPIIGMKTLFLSDLDSNVILQLNRRKEFFVENITFLIENTSLENGLSRKEKSREPGNTFIVMKDLHDPDKNILSIENLVKIIGSDNCSQLLDYCKY